MSLTPAPVRRYCSSSVSPDQSDGRWRAETWRLEIAATAAPSWSAPIGVVEGDVLAGLPLTEMIPPPPPPP